MNEEEKQLTYAELMMQIAEAEAKAQAAREKAAALRGQAIAEMVEDIKQAIVDSGLPMDEVLSGLGVGSAESAPKPKRARKEKAEGSNRRPRAVYVDGDGREYRGGKPPAWLTEAMAATGVATAAEYREQYMILKEAA